jgi:hypothetical protein
MMLALAFFALATTAQGISHASHPVPLSCLRILGAHQLTDHIPAAITILYPTSQTVWYKNDTVQLNWTVSDPTTDTYLVRVFLSNQDQSLYAGNNSIVDGSESGLIPMPSTTWLKADLIANATATFVSIKLPNVPAGFVHTSPHPYARAQLTASQLAPAT